jgi:cation diffusion facilitator family transporter
MDVVSSMIGLTGIKMSQKPPDKEHPYGHYKFEVLSGLFITVILFITGLLIIYEAFIAFLKPKPIEYQSISMITMAISASINEIMARLKIHFGKKENSMSLLSDGIHSRVDVYTSIAVFFGLIFDKYWIYSDSTLALLIGLFILKESIELGKESTDSLLDASAGEEVENKIRSVIENNDIKLTDLKTQKKGSVITANLKISLPIDTSVEEATKISNSLKEKLIQEIENLEYVSIQIEGHDISTSYFAPKGALAHGFGWENRPKGKNVNGPPKNCVCPNCGYTVEHKRGIPCTTLKCPKCGTLMARENTSKE